MMSPQIILATIELTRSAIARAAIAIIATALLTVKSLRHISAIVSETPSFMIYLVAREGDFKIVKI